jgi:hypothetical protein
MVYNYSMSILFILINSHLFLNYCYQNILLVIRHLHVRYLFRYESITVYPVNVYY